MSKAKKEQPKSQPHTVVCLNEVNAEPVTWLWRGRVPAGKLTLLDGDPGLGKSTLTLAIAAAVSKGAPMPGETDAVPAGNVLLVCVEDGLGDTIVPRLHALRRLHREPLLVLPHGLTLRAQIEPSRKELLADADRSAELVLMVERASVSRPARHR